MSSKTLKEADRVMTICNACRYCEGFCAVFPAMELRRTFSGPDLKYLANLCHNCRGCYYACQYAPPHEFMLNIPRALAELRQETYRESSWPQAMKGFFQNNGLLVSLITALSIAVVLLLTLLFQGHDVLLGTHRGEGAFYRVIPYAAMVVPFTALSGAGDRKFRERVRQSVAGNRWHTGRPDERVGPSAGHRGRTETQVFGWRRIWVQLSR